MIKKKISTLGYLGMAATVHLLGISIASAGCLESYAEAMAPKKHDIAVGVATGFVSSSTTKLVQLRDLGNVRQLILDSQVGQGMYLNQIADHLAATPDQVATAVRLIDSNNGFCLDGPVSPKLAEAMVAQAIVR